MRYPTAIGFVIASWVLLACGADTPTKIEAPASQGPKDIAPSELKIVPPNPQPSESQEKESGPSAKPAPAESRTPEEAARRAADPKDPSGALIIEKPVGAGSKP